MQNTPTPTKLEVVRPQEPIREQAFEPTPDQIIIAKKRELNTLNRMLAQNPEDVETLRSKASALKTIEMQIENMSLATRFEQNIEARKKYEDDLKNTRSELMETIQTINKIKLPKALKIEGLSETAAAAKLKEQMPVPATAEVKRTEIPLTEEEEKLVGEIKAAKQKEERAEFTKEDAARESALREEFNRLSGDNDTLRESLSLALKKDITPEMEVKVGFFTSREIKKMAREYNSNLKRLRDISDSLIKQVPEGGSFVRRGEAVKTSFRPTGEPIELKKPPKAASEYVQTFTAGELMPKQPEREKVVLSPEAQKREEEFIKYGLRFGPAENVPAPKRKKTIESDAEAMAKVAQYEAVAEYIMNGTLTTPEAIVGAMADARLLDPKNPDDAYDIILDGLTTERDAARKNERKFLNEEGKQIPMSELDAMANWILMKGSNEYPLLVARKQSLGKKLSDAIASRSYRVSTKGGGLGPSM